MHFKLGAGNNTSPCQCWDQETQDTSWHPWQRHVAVQESKSQADFDAVLREARMLRDDLNHESARCRTKGKATAAEAAELEAKRAKLGGKSAPPHLLQAAGQARLRAEEVSPFYPIHAFN